MTFAPNQVITTEEWERKHRGHALSSKIEEVGIKRMHWRVCLNCGARHLFRMETIEPKESV